MSLSLSLLAWAITHPSLCSCKCACPKIMTKLRLTNSFPHAGQGCVRSFLGCTTFVMQLQLELPDMIWYCMVSYMVLCGIGWYYMAWYCGIVWYCMVLSFLRCTTRICAASAQLIHFQLHLQRERVARRQEHNRVVHFVQLHWLWHWSSDSVCRSFVLQTSRSFVFISVMQAPKVYFWSNICRHSINYFKVLLFLTILGATFAFVFFFCFFLKYPGNILQLCCWWWGNY